MPPTASLPGGFRPGNQPSFVFQPQLIDFLFGRKHQQLINVLGKLDRDVGSILGQCRTSLRQMIPEHDRLATESSLSSRIDSLRQSVDLTRTQVAIQPELAKKSLEELVRTTDSLSHQQTQSIEASISTAQSSIIKAVSQAMQNEESKTRIGLEVKLSVLVQDIAVIKEVFRTHDVLFQALRADMGAQSETFTSITRSLQCLITDSKALKTREKDVTPRNKNKRDRGVGAHKKTKSIAVCAENNILPAMTTRAAARKARQKDKRKRT